MKIKLKIEPEFKDEIESQHYIFSESKIFKLNPTAQLIFDLLSTEKSIDIDEIFFQLNKEYPQLIITEEIKKEVLDFLEILHKKDLIIKNA